MTTLTVNEIICLLALSGSRRVPAAHRDGGAALLRLRQLSLIDNVGAELSPRGEAMVKMLLETPLPVATWKDPRELG